ncbi:MAG: hypothetical protein QOE28_5 [Solirubrobacteraceae bacterium]|jgi:hypothetical protein|nr:hypothetical protein [Solirubrobacteraceae bacterium]
MRFTLRVGDPSGEEIHAIALGAQLHFEPAKRRYDDATRARLVELFGTPDRWAATTTRSFVWAQLGAVVPAFRGQTEFALDVACTYDLDVAAAKYVHSLPDGEVPLAFHFSGTILYGQLQIAMVPWSCSAHHKLPVETWRAMMAAHYPGGSWIRLGEETLERLAARKASAHHPSFDATVRELLDA